MDLVIAGSSPVSSDAGSNPVMVNVLPAIFSDYGGQLLSLENIFIDIIKL